MEWLQLGNVGPLPLCELSILSPAGQQHHPGNSRLPSGEVSLC
jgi:hypothetical protein